MGYCNVRGKLEGGAYDPHICPATPMGTWSVYASFSPPKWLMVWPKYLSANPA